MIDEVVDLVVAVHERGTVLWLGTLVGEEIHHTLEMRNIPHQLVRFGVLRRGLRLGDGLEGFDLAVVELRVFAIIGQAHRGGIDPMKFGQRADSIVPPAMRSDTQTGPDSSHSHLLPFLDRHIRERSIDDDPAVQKLHNVKGSANDALVFTETIRFGYGNIGLLQGMNDAVFAIDLVRRLGD